MTAEEFVNNLTTETLTFVFLVAVGLLTFALLKEITR